MLKIVLGFLLLIWGSTNLYAMQVKGVFINCKGGDVCDFFKSNSKILKRKFKDQKEFLNVLKVFYSRNGYDQFSYNVKKMNKDYFVFVDITPQPLLEDVDILLLNSNIPTSFLYDVLEVREGEFVDDQIIDSDRKKIVKKLSLLGYPDAIVVAKKEKISEYKVSLTYKISIVKTIITKSITFSCMGEFARSLKGRYFQDLINLPLNKEYIIQETKDFNEALKGSGYFLSNVQYRIDETLKEANVHIDCGNMKRIIMTLDDLNGVFKKEDVYHELRDYLSATKKVFTPNDLRRLIEEMFIKKGYDRPDIQISENQEKQGVDKIVRIGITVNKVERSKIRQVAFKGNSFYSSDQLRDMYEDSSSDLAEANYVDEQFYQVFSENLRKKYIENGYIKAQVSFFLKPFSSKNEKEVLFVVREGVRTSISKVEIIELNSYKIPKEIIDEFDIRVNEVFNPIKLDNSLKVLVTTLKENGFFFASIKNNIDDDIVEYTNATNEVEIKILLDIGPRVKVNNVLVYGLEKTKESVVTRKLNEVKGQFYTPTLEKKVYSRLASLGIFRNYSLLYLRGEENENDLDLLVNVREKDYGVIEIAPGFRTDIGLKLSGKVSRINLFGLNQGVSISGQTNYRLSDETIDTDRTILNNYEDHMLEYSVKLNYLYPDLFKSYWDYFASISTARTRFYSFDANIFRVSNTFRREITDYLSFSLNHQYERIEQFSASPRDDGIDDNGKFTIGTLTPSIVLDFRDSPIIPRKGTFFQFSYEMAKPEFFSQEEMDLTIDYYKFIVRNKSYIPITENLYIATSLATGIQKNKADEIVQKSNGDYETAGFIPAIKAFRLTGVDTVRGYAEDEINTITDPSDKEVKDISDYAIRDKAYMINFKFEPRYIVTDTFMLGVFFDAGRIQVSDYDPLDLRSAVGLSLKYITPVGTLDLDYGFKIDRGTNLDGEREAPGRIHLSIGFF
ncbi:MAG: BamA/TamA family outer membrane protein [Halobacteriovoraceae bacterium]|nr:BamA/TamA family outer membrane protein [Halobacteriovoraceae bacterium]